MTATGTHIVRWVCGGLLAACLAASFIAGAASRRPIECTGVDVVIADSLRNRFVSGQDIRRYLDKEMGGYKGMPIDSIDLVKVEQIIDGKSAVLKSEAYVTKDGMLRIIVTQRCPVVRFQTPEGGFYADKEGRIFPLQNSYASHVQVVDGELPIKLAKGFKGEIDDPQAKEWFGRMMGFINHLENDPVWKGKIVQIHVENGGELTLIPREGKERFMFGQPVKIEDKFRRMEKYYTAIIPEKGKDRYRSVTVKYDGQIVCR